MTDDWVKDASNQRTRQGEAMKDGSVIVVTLHMQTSESNREEEDRFDEVERSSRCSLLRIWHFKLHWFCSQNVRHVLGLIFIQRRARCKKTKCP